MIKWRTKTKAKNNVIRFLRSVSIFSELSDMQLWYISQRMDHRQCPKGSFILKEGTTGENCFFIVDGSVKITRSSREGRSIILAMLGIGDFFGEMSMFDGEIRSANVLAQEDTDILALSRKDFINILKEFPEISIQLLTEIAIRMRKSDQHITSLTLNSAEKRIGVCILRLAEEQGMIKQRAVDIKNFPFQCEIANIVGTSRETVNRAFVLFENKGLIQRDGRTLKIINYMDFQQEFET